MNSKFRTAIFYSILMVLMTQVSYFGNDNISEEDVVRLEISTGEPIFYKFINGKFIRQ